MVLRAADGKGGNWTKRVGLADDFEDADGEHVLDFWQAIDRARQLARGTDADAGRPATVGDAVATYERDLIARGGLISNASRIRKHLTPTLAAKPISLLSARDLAAWRDGVLAAGMKPATAVRLTKALKAALSLCARRDPARITNAAAWRDGLSGLAEGFTSRNVQRLDDDQVRDVIAAAYAIDPSFGLFIEVAAVTGARVSQIARLVVSDLRTDSGAPRLMMPCSRKGSRSRKPGKHPVPITAELAAKLASNRPVDAPLLLRSDGRAWQSKQLGDHGALYQQAAKRAGIHGTAYALRHSSIIRSLLHGVPVRVICANHDTSIVMLERTYSSYISDYSDAVARPALLATPPLADGNKVIALGRRRP